MSSIEETPPEIITGQLDTFATLVVSSKLGLCFHAISIYICIN